MRRFLKAKPTVVINGVPGFRITYVIGPEGTESVTLMPTESRELEAGKRLVIWAVQALDDPAIAGEVEAWYEAVQRDEMRRTVLDMLGHLSEVAAMREP